MTAAALEPQPYLWRDRRDALDDRYWEALSPTMFLNYLQRYAPDPDAATQAVCAQSH